MGGGFGCELDAEFRCVLLGYEVKVVLKFGDVSSEEGEDPKANSFDYFGVCRRDNELDVWASGSAGETMNWTSVLLSPVSWLIRTRIRVR